MGWKRIGKSLVSRAHHMGESTRALQLHVIEASSAQDGCLASDIEIGKEIELAETKLVSLLVENRDVSKMPDGCGAGSWRDERWPTTADIKDGVERCRVAAHKLGANCCPIIAASVAHEASVLYAAVLAARNKLVMSRIKEVHFASREFVGRDLPALDLVQEGCIGLMRAAEKYDYRVAVSFKTYSQYWIRQAMMRALNSKGMLVRMPAHRYEHAGKLLRAMRRVEKLGSADPIVDAAELIGISVDDARALLRWSQKPLPLDKQLFGDNEDRTYLDVFVVDESDAQAASAEHDKLSRDIWREVTTLSPREQEIINIRYKRDATLEEIGEMIGITREGVRVAELTALRKLRRRKSVESLAEFLG